MRVNCFARALKMTNLGSEVSISTRSFSSNRIPLWLELRIPTVRTTHWQYPYRTLTTSAVLLNSTGTQPQKVDTGSTPPELEDWKTIYRFNHILIARFIQRVKVYQTALTCGILLPATIASTYLMETTDETAMYFVFGVSTLACVMLGVMGTMASRVIGIMYVNRKDPSQLRIARLSFFGSRIDEYLPTDSFLPITHSRQNIGDAYVVLETVDSDKPVAYPLLEGILPENKYYLSLKYGTILDWDAFTEVFGDEIIKK